MPKEYEELTAKIIKLIEDNPGQPAKNLAKKLSINRTFLAGYLKVLEEQSYVKKIEPAKVYLRET